MPDDAIRYSRYRFPPIIISHAVWLYYRFSLSLREVEDLLAHRRTTVTDETVRHWCQTFGCAYARRLRRRHGRVGDTRHLDELFVTIRGQRRYLWRAVDQDGDVLDILPQSRRDRPLRRRTASTARPPSTAPRHAGVRYLERRRGRVRPHRARLPAADVCRRDR